jgi:hypothetical protein
MKHVSAFSVLTLMLLLSASAFSFPPGEGIAGLQREVSGLSTGERIARWAEEFVGTPYDPDPRGLYVTEQAIVADRAVDCMYHTFRSVELGLSQTPREAAERALEMRFHTQGHLEADRVTNYEDRFQYAMDMIASGKWGSEVTATLGPTEHVPGSRGYPDVAMIPASRIRSAKQRLRSGDIAFFVKDPSRRVVGEVIGHIGIIKREGDAVWLIHASGTKGRGGEVRKVLLSEYATSMPFVGMKVTRFSVFP